MYQRFSYLTRGLWTLGIGGVMACLAPAQDISQTVINQMNAMATTKRSFTAVQKKVSSNLVFAAMAARNDARVAVFTDVIANSGVGTGPVSVDIRADVTPALLDAITAAGGTVLEQSATWGMIHATLPVEALETVAASPNVKSVRPQAFRKVSGIAGRQIGARRATPSSIVSRSGVGLAGALTSQGYITQSANLVVNNQGINGAGVTVGVLSDSASAARVAALIASGDLPATASVLPGQAGPADGSDEGAAMMEIIHDMAPGANIIFATAFSSEVGFANNIIALQQAGCKVIVDDVSYFDEGVFQDGPVAQAVNQVTAAGVTYLSSAGNGGNLTFNTSGTWEGDFLSGGAATGVIAGAGNVHNFGGQNFDRLTAATPYVQVKWSDPLGGSTNDYDLYVLNSAGTTLKALSTDAQSGTQDPYELACINANCTTNFAVNDRVVIALFDGATRALHLETLGGTLQLSTSGSTSGHNAGQNTVSVAATYWNSARTGTRPFVGATNPIEVFSSDGPRKIFYNPNGTPITPGNLLFGTNGGTTLVKPDVTATDGGSTKTPGFNPFFGTSAASPHAAGVAALILQAKPTYTPTQVKAALRSGVVDNMAAGVDRDSGYGIVMATLAVQYALSH